MHSSKIHLFFFFNDTATTEIYTLSLHDALPIFGWFDFRQFSPAVDDSAIAPQLGLGLKFHVRPRLAGRIEGRRSEEHTSELQSQSNLVCRLLLEKKKTNRNTTHKLKTQPLKLLT